MSTPEAVIWHDLECGAYTADLERWLALAAAHEGPVLDVGAGTGRVALPLARHGNAVIALERDEELAAELRRRALGSEVEVICGDACDFAMARAVGLAIVPMQTVHLLADPPAFLRCARAALREDGVLAVALLGEGVEPFELELPADAALIDGVRFESVPTALRREGGAVILERRRTQRADGQPSRSRTDRICLRDLDSATLGRDAQAAGFRTLETLAVAPTAEHAGSVIVVMEVLR